MRREKSGTKVRDKSQGKSQGQKPGTKVKDKSQGQKSGTKVRDKSQGQNIRVSGCGWLVVCVGWDEVKLVVGDFKLYVIGIDLYFSVGVNAEWDGGGKVDFGGCVVVYFWEVQVVSGEGGWEDSKGSLE